MLVVCLFFYLIIYCSFIFDISIIIFDGWEGGVRMERSCGQADSGLYFHLNCESQKSATITKNLYKFLLQFVIAGWEVWDIQGGWGGGGGGGGGILLS